MSDNTQSVGSTLPRGAHSHVYSLPRGAWECCRDAPRPCRQVGALSRRCIRCRRTIGLSLDAERRVYTPTRSVGASWGMERGRAPRPCRQVGALSRRCVRCRRTIGVSLDAERRVYTPTRSVGASWWRGVGALGPRWPDDAMEGAVRTSGAVLAGAGRALVAPALLGVIMELNGSGARYGGATRMRCMGICWAAGSRPSGIGRSSGCLSLCTGRARGAGTPCMCGMPGGWPSGCDRRRGLRWGRVGVSDPGGGVDGEPVGANEFVPTGGPGMRSRDAQPS